jgi:phosphate starvation-inducible protein PhoH
MSLKKKPVVTETEQKYKTKKEFIIDVIKKKPKDKFLTKNQELYYKMLKEKEIVICSGKAGVGKSYISMKAAIDLLADPNNTYE